MDGTVSAPVLLQNAFGGVEWGTDLPPSAWKKWVVLQFPQQVGSTG